MNEGHTNISIRTVDTDVLVLAVTVAERIKIPEIGIALEVEKISDLAPHEMARGLGPERLMALPMFHAFAGCGTV